MYLKDMVDIYTPLKTWLSTWSDKIDPKTKSELFTGGTQDTICLVIKNTEWLVNWLQDEVKYIEIKP